MFSFFKKKQEQGSELKLKLSGLHCTNCALSIDDAVEEIEGVYSSSTNYARSEVMIRADLQKAPLTRIIAKIEELGYRVAHNP